MKKGDPIEYTDEHQSGKEIFNEVKKLNMNGICFYMYNCCFFS